MSDTEYEELFCRELQWVIGGDQSVCLPDFDWVGRDWYRVDGSPTVVAELITREGRERLGRSCGVVRFDACEVFGGMDEEEDEEEDEGEDEDEDGVLVREDVVDDSASAV